MYSNLDIINNDSTMRLDQVKNSSQLVEYMKTSPIGSPFYYWTIINKVGRYNLSPYMYHQRNVDWNGEI